MPMTGLGDLAQSNAMRGHNLMLRRELDGLVKELSTGEVADIPARLRGDFTSLSAIETTLTGLDAYDAVLIEAGNFAASMQTALDAVQTSLADTGAKLLTATKPGDEKLLDATVAEAARRFEAIVSHLNTREGNRSLFAGNAVDQPALASAEAIKTGLSAAVTGLTTAADIRTAVDAWFDTPGGGFDTIAYLGSADTLDPFQISDVSSASLDLRAQDDEIRALLKEFTLIALIDDGLLAGDLSEKKLLADGAGLGMVNAERDLTFVRARIGTEEANIEDTGVRNSAERSSLLAARDLLVGADPYETATKLEDAETQLQLLYSLTARLADLSLVGYLR